MKRIYKTPNTEVSEIQLAHIIANSPDVNVSNSVGDGNAPAYSKDRDNNLEGSMGSLW